MIYVQIAAYRDPELLPTIQDALAKAKYPADLRFGVCWQHGDEDTGMQAFAKNSQFCIDDVPWRQSRGLGWARARLQKMWEGEEFTLQLDSHHRFIQDWDVLLREDCEATGSPKPIITTYAGTYDPAGTQAPATEPYCMVADKFTPHGTILFRPQVIKDWRSMEQPLRARFVSGHFYFTLGRHCEEYTYDPELYFAGDEISLAVRSFTSGYDLFHPHRLRIWHEYTRAGRVKHWDDHLPKNEVVAWHERDRISKMRLRQMLYGEHSGMDLGSHTLGTVRSLAEYERYAGIDFMGRRLHPEARQGTEPPCSFFDESSWELAMSTWEYTFSWPATLADGADFLYLGIENADGEVLHRVDLRDGLAVGSFRVQFQSASKPTKWVVLKHTVTGWEDRHEGAI